MKVCLDSDILIDFLRNDKQGVEILSQLENDELYITSINSFEIFKGLKNSTLSREEIIDFLSHFKILSFDYDCSEKATEIFNYLKSKGEMIELTDIMIASICIIKKQKLATHNKKHFTKIPEIELY
jgi:tRNA(fMet)-specific endonuclease VapC